MHVTVCKYKHHVGFNQLIGEVITVKTTKLEWLMLNIKSETI